MKTKLNIIVVHGGASSEKAISTINAGYIARSLEETGHEVCMLEFDENTERVLAAQKPKLVFIAVQGKHHGDGKLQSICEHLKLPYTGSKAAAAAIINDKFMCKEVCAKHGIRTPEFICIHKEQYFEVPKEEILKKIKKVMPFPVVAKAVGQGGSFGIEYIESEKDYEKIAATFAFDDKIIIERFIKGKFITISILEIQKKPTALPALSAEILPGEQNDILLFNQSFVMKDANLSARLQEETDETSLKVFNIINAKNYARVDYIIEEQTGLLYFLEINAVPGLKPSSFYPLSAEKYGISFNDLIETIVSNEL
ncbi:D-alanine--D-alanine ligase family protein [Candidatus Contubernalis alkaliaceticus]|uniref:D-alanine--D-alanine ligase family protein n=1 Tax=Candidatus Contubernalis alkaliaceticus TaxID=338645 RepID=UPI001F4BD9BE|nr:ATP-grasp domain-containing protein [Candidatus Contubernalis alkalaceticus]UNC93516.1 ATP-grasp domain-containing protein [Candidatus Contubernalis alkalaceticus]